MKKSIRIALSVAFLLVGVLGLVLPILPGTVFLALGVLGLSTVFHPLRRPFEYLKKNHPNIHDVLHRWQRRVFPDDEA